MIDLIEVKCFIVCVQHVTPFQIHILCNIFLKFRDGMKCGYFQIGLFRLNQHSNSRWTLRFPVKRVGSCTIVRRGENGDNLSVKYSTG